MRLNQILMTSVNVNIKELFVNLVLQGNSLFARQLLSSELVYNLLANGFKF